MHDALCISLISSCYILHAYSAYRTTNYGLGPLKEILIALTSTLWHHYSYSISYILVAIASSARIPRQGHPTVRMESCSSCDEWLYSSIVLLQFPRGGRNPGYKMSIVQSTLDCSLVPTVVLHQYASITVLVTSTWWLSLTVDHFCFAKFENFQCTKFLPQLHFDIRFMYPRFFDARLEHHCSLRGYESCTTPYFLFRLLT